MRYQPTPQEIAAGWYPAGNEPALGDDDLTPEQVARLDTVVDQMHTLFAKLGVMVDQLSSRAVTTGGESDDH